MKEKIKQLEEEKQVLLSKASDITKQINSLKRELWSTETGLNIGDSVTFLDGRELKSGKLIDIDVKYSFFTYPKVRLFKKDGSLGLRDMNVHNVESMKRIS